ncbi:MAG: hypothetical protein ACP5CD_06695 [Thermovirgaceae bacterium]
MTQAGSCAGVLVPRSSGVSGTMLSQKAAQMHATAMGVVMIAQIT